MLKRTTDLTLEPRDTLRPSYASSLWLGAGVILAPSAIFLALWHRFGFTLPPFNADLFVVYIASILVARRLGRRLGAVTAVFGTALALGIHVFFGLGFIYIDDPALIREYLGFVTVWPWRLILTYSALAAAVLAALFWLVAKLPIAEARIKPVIPLILIAVAIDLVGRAPALHRYVGANLVTSSAVRTSKLLHALATKPRFAVAPLLAPMMARDARAAAADGGSVLSISVEALGLAEDDRLNRYIAAGLTEAVRGRYTVERRSHAARGGTLTGEMRELCNLKTAGTPTRADAAAIAPQCLPKALRAAGFGTLAIHGNSGIFYNRSQLYPILGFDRALFRDDLLRAPYRARECRKVAFEGICDQSALEIATDFTSVPKRYAHVMTLDTHFPLAPSRAGENSCLGVPGARDPDICLYGRQFAELLTMIGRTLVSAPNGGPETVYLFGDHPPPYAVAKARNQFARDRVPYLILRKVR